MDYLKVEILYFTDFLGIKVSPVVQSTSPVHRSSPPIVYSPRTWTQIADLPTICSTFESFHGSLLAIGGKDSLTGNPTTALYAYTAATNSWEKVSHLKTGRYNCFTAVLSDNRLMVVGGFTGHYSCSMSDSVEFAN